MGQAPAGLAISFLVHVPQLVLTGLAWRTLLPPSMRPAARTMVGLRWIRELLNALVPAGAIIGQAVAARRLTQAGIPADLAGATATVDMTIEGGTQAVITLVGLVLLLVVRGDLQMGGVVMIGIALAVAATVAMVTVQRNLPVRLVQAACGRLAPNWSALNGDWLADFQRSVLRLHAERRTLLRAATFHLSAWTLGAVDIAGVLYLLGHPISLADGFVVESSDASIAECCLHGSGRLGRAGRRGYRVVRLSGSAGRCRTDAGATATNARGAARRFRSLRCAQNAFNKSWFDFDGNFSQPKIAIGRSANDVWKARNASPRSPSAATVLGRLCGDPQVFRIGRWQKKGEACRVMQGDRNGCEVCNGERVHLGNMPEPCCHNFRR